MPELPEVEFARSLACRECRGKTITEVLAEEDAKVFEDKTPAELESVLKGRSVAAVLRKGKYFWFELTGQGPHILFHFGMTGHLAIKDVAGAKYVRLSAENGEWPPRFTKLQLTFDDGTKMAFADSRRFARVKLLEKPEAQEPISKLGPDAHLELPSLEAFQQLMAKQKRAVKAVLLDQAILSGIGNWVGDEVLYQARLFPEQPCCELSAEEVQQLHTAIRDVLTLSVSVGADHHQFPKHWIFHYRWTGKTASEDFHGNTIKFITVGGRTTAYVPALQKLPPGRHSTAGRKAKITDGADKSKGDKGDAGNDSGAAGTSKGAKAKTKRTAKAAEEDAAPVEAPAEAQSGGEAVGAKATGKAPAKGGGRRAKRKADDSAAATANKTAEPPAMGELQAAAELADAAEPSEAQASEPVKKGRKVGGAKAVIATVTESTVLPTATRAAGVRKTTRSQTVATMSGDTGLVAGADLDVPKAGQSAKKRRPGALLAQRGEPEVVVGDVALRGKKSRKTGRA